MLKIKIFILYINLLSLFLISANKCFALSADSYEDGQLLILPNNPTIVAENVVRQNAIIEDKKIPILIFSENNHKNGFITFSVPAITSEFRGIKVEIVTTSLNEPKDANTSDVYQAHFFQNDAESKGKINIISSSPVRTLLPSKAYEIRTIELESCYQAESGKPINIKIERKKNDPFDTFESPCALLMVKITLVKDLPKPFLVEGRLGYNSWPMMQALGNKLVCTYSRGSGHTIAEGSRGIYVRNSSDGGITWSEESLISNDQSYGEVPIGKGLDENNHMLLWVRFVGKDRIHKLYRTKDGINFTHISSPKFDPMPMQVTDVFSVPTVGLMAIWFTGNYGEKSLNAWGTLVSKDNGLTWTQNVIESGLKNIDWNTEQSAVYLGDGKILGIARVEHSSNTTERAQFQLESKDYGKTWTRSRTNISDIYISTPSLIFDKNTGIISNYYYQRGRGLLKRRAVDANKIFGNPLSWPEPEIIAFASAIGYDAGNVNATVLNGKHYLAYYSGDRKNTVVLVSATNPPKFDKETAKSK